MPIGGTEQALGNAIANAILSLRPDETSPVSNAQLIEIWVSVSAEIINHIVANAQVTGVVTGGAGSGGPVTGTIL